MRILLVHNYYRYPGGEETYVSSLERLLKKKGHRVKVWTKDNKQIEKKGLFGKVKIAISMFWNIGTLRELSEVIREYKPDIVHFNNVFPLISPTAYWACKKNNVPIVQTIHNFRYMFPKSLLIRRGKLCSYCLDKRLIYPSFMHDCYNEPFIYTFFFSTSHLFHYYLGSFYLVDTFVFPSQFAKNYYLKNSRIEEEKAVVIPNFVDNNQERMKLVIKGDYYLYVGSIAEQKGIFELLETFSNLPDQKLFVIGGGPETKKTAKYKKFNNIKFEGPLPHKEVFAYMKEALFTIVPSKSYEVMPTVVIESFSNKTAAVVPKFGVFKELVREGKTGVLYRYRDYEDLKRKIIKFSKNKSLASSMGNFAKKEYLSKYRPGSYYKKLFKVYQKLCKQN